MGLPALRGNDDEKNAQKRWFHFDAKTTRIDVYHFLYVAQYDKMWNDSIA